MKIIYFTILFSLISCNYKSGSQGNQNLDEQDSSDEYYQKSYQVLITRDSIAISKKNIQMGVNFKSTELCDDRKGIFTDEKKLRKHGANLPYGLKKAFKNDSLHYTFEIITECCHDFMGGIEIINDTLFLNYLNYNWPCDCYCDYRLTYSFKKKEQTWKAVKTREITLDFKR